MTKNEFELGDTVTLSRTALSDPDFNMCTGIRPYNKYTIKTKEYTLGEWFYKVYYKDDKGDFITEPIYLNEKHITRLEEAVNESVSNAVQPDHYNANDDNDVIAMWSRIMKPNEFRRTMFSHISKYLFRYPNKNYQEDFNKAKEYVRRLEKWENETGNFGKEVTQ